MAGTEPTPQNPFIQGTTPSDTPEETLSSAQTAAEALISYLDKKIDDSFKNREKFIKSITAGEEDYWKTATRYANSHAGMLNQQHDQRIRDIRRERDAEIEKAKRTEDGLKNLASIRDKYRKQEEDALKRHEGQQERLSNISRLHGGVTRAAGIVMPEAGTALASIGTLVAESATGVGFFVAALELAAKAAVSLSERQAELSRSSAGLIAAGYTIGTKGQKSEDIREALFGGKFTGILGVGAGRKAVNTLEEAPALLSEAQGNITKFQNTLSAFGTIIPDANEEIEMFSKNSRSLGLDLNSLSNVYGVSRRAAQLMGGGLKEWNANQKDTIDMYLGLQKAFRGFTTDGTIATGTLFGLSAGLKKLFPGPEEMKQAVQTIGEGIGGQSFTTLSGLYALTHGGQLPQEKDPYAKGGSLSNATKVVNDAVKYIMAQAGGDNFTRNAIQQGLMAQLGINLPGRVVPHFAELIGQAALPVSEEDKAKAKALAAEATKVGTEDLIKSQGFLKSSTDRLTNAFTKYAFNTPGPVGMGLNMTPIGIGVNALFNEFVIAAAKNGARNAKKQ
jgi:hypothetical protein